MKRAVAALLLALCACAPRVPATNPFSGLVTKVDPTHLDVRGVGGTYAFDLADPLVTVAHLLEHENSSWPVLVTFTIQKNRLIATRVADGPR